MSFPPAVWRLLITPPSSGAWNMAVDEVILESVGRGDSLATLRLYAWQPPCLSLGYAQPFSDVDADVLRELGWDVVRRQTGGRAILHTDELTYSVIGPYSEPRLSGGVLESYQVIAGAWLRALEMLRIHAQVVEKESAGASMPGFDQARRNTNPVCFEAPSDYEIVAQGKKLVGSAQARRRAGVLQHGTLPLTGDLARIIRVLRFPDPHARELAADRLLARATTVEEVLGSFVAWETAARALIQAFTEKLNLELNPGYLTPEEENLAGKLVDEKYGNPEWIGRL